RSAMTVPSKFRARPVRVERQGLETRSGRRAEAAGRRAHLRLVVRARRGTCVKEAAPLPAPAASPRQARRAKLVSVRVLTIVPCRLPNHSPRLDDGSA